MAMRIDRAAAAAASICEAHEYIYFVCENKNGRMKIEYRKL